MLVLSRRNNESIIIDDRIKVRVLGISGKKVKLAVEAPPDVKVHRNEVWEAIQRAGKDQEGPKSDIVAVRCPMTT